MDASAARIFHDPHPLGRFERLADYIHDAPDDPFLWIPGDWSSEEDAARRMRAAIDAGADFAVGRWVDVSDVAYTPSRATATLTVTGLVESPSRLGPIALRPSVLRAFDFDALGPTDAVADAAAEWLIAIAVLAMGRRGAALDDVVWRRMRPAPEDPDMLTPEGVAWLVDLALKVAKPDEAVLRDLVRRWRASLGGARA